jgi:hypothetical protein
MYYDMQWVEAPGMRRRRRQWWVFRVAHGFGIACAQLTRMACGIVKHWMLWPSALDMASVG